MSETETPALVVFHGRGRGFWPWLCGRPGFRHCFIALNDGRAWIVVDARRDGLHIDADLPAGFDLAGHCRLLGFTVIETAVTPARRCCVLPGAFTCVEAVKRALGLRAWRVWTPYQLYRRLEKESDGKPVQSAQAESPAAAPAAAEARRPGHRGGAQAGA